LLPAGSAAVLLLPAAGSAVVLLLPAAGSAVVLLLPAAGSAVVLLLPAGTDAVFLLSTAAAAPFPWPRPIACCTHAFFAAKVPFTHAHAGKTKG
jgi:hypothetical protein